MAHEIETELVSVSQFLLMQWQDKRRYSRDKTAKYTKTKKPMKRRGF